MAKPGRQSAASLSVISSGGLETVRRPSAPRDLTDEQAGEWKAIVNGLAADWFRRENLALLAQYCRHIVAARRVAQWITALETPDPDNPDATINIEEYDRLLKMQEREGRAISSLATRMRLTQQTTYDKQTKKPSQTAKPWEFGNAG